MKAVVTAKIHGVFTTPAEYKTTIEFSKNENVFGRILKTRQLLYEKFNVKGNQIEIVDVKYKEK